MLVAATVVVVVVNVVVVPLACSVVGAHWRTKVGSLKDLQLLLFLFWSLFSLFARKEAPAFSLVFGR